jgi:hypothetical protein
VTSSEAKYRQRRAERFGLASAAVAQLQSLATASQRQLQRLNASHATTSTACQTEESSFLAAGVPGQPQVIRGDASQSSSAAATSSSSAAASVSTGTPGPAAQSVDATGPTLSTAAVLSALTTLGVGLEDDCGTVAADGEVAVTADSVSAVDPIARGVCGVGTDAMLPPA